ncbi:DUF4123 domain-containing protein [Providencia sp. Je.9.19]|uniref:DUF4123 domain-containing protein n=1 Tax=Providencia sp. Je.9.19 TaxID=3142844 RepID=UPI003DA9FEBF
MSQIQRQTLPQAPTSTESPTWLSWLTGTSQNDVYFLINTLSDPNPIKRFYTHDWIEEAFPIYHGTALAHLVEVSPWLVKIKRSQLFHLGQALDNKPYSDTSWGWAYQSQLDWGTQITHWQKYQFALMGEEKIIFRFFDARVARTLLPKLNKGDWSLLMMPVEDCFIENGETNSVFSRPQYADPFISPADYTLGEHLIQAWRNSNYAIDLIVENMLLNFWEDRGELALRIFNNESNIEANIKQWLIECQSKNVDITYLSTTHLVEHLININVINKEDRHYD